MNIRNVVVASYIVIGLFLAADIAWNWRDVAGALTDFLAAGIAGYAVVLIVGLAPVSSLVLAALVHSDARGFVMLPFLAHTIVAFPAAVLPAGLLFFHRIGKSRRSHARHAESGA